MKKQVRIATQQAFPLSEAAQYFPKRNGKKVHYSTLYRWATKGVRGRVLETQVVGGIYYTTKAAICSFTNASLPSIRDPQIAAIQQQLGTEGV